MAINRSIAAVVGGGLALLPVAALAHAHLDHASPAVGSTVAQPPSGSQRRWKRSSAPLKCAMFKAGPCKQDPPRLPAATLRNSACRSRH